MSLWLDQDELVELTGYKRAKEQRAALSSLGIDFRTRPADGFPLVARAQFEQLTAGKRQREPDFSALKGI